jgi:hypothetical protein
MTPDDKLQSLLSMLAERGKLRPYNFPVMQMTMPRTLAELQREAEDMDFEFHWTNP